MTKFRILALIALLFISCDVNKKQQNLDSKQDSNTKNQMEELIKILIKDSKHHQEIGPKLTDSDINGIEDKLGLSLPYSYKLFLKLYGNGAYWLYMTSIDDITQFSYLREYRKELGKTIELVGENKIQVDSLLCLMTEDSNGGAWVWLTSKNSDNGEWPLAYYSMSDKKLHYKVENFIEWLRLLIKCKSEVIRELDVENKLGLG